MVLGFYYGFIIAPPDKILGDSQRILYLHVGCATTAYIMTAFLFLGALGFILSEQRFWHNLAKSAGYAAFVLMSFVLLSGMFWAHTAWNVWWRWEPKLTSSLILTLTLMTYVLSDLYIKKGNEQIPAAIGIFAALNVPLVTLAIRLFPNLIQLHPEVVSTGGLKDPHYYYALGFTSLGVFGISLACFIGYLMYLELVDKLREYELRRILNNE